MLDFSNTPIIDVHAHPYTRQESLSPDDWVNVTAFGGSSREYLEAGGIKVDDTFEMMLQQLKRDTIYFRYMIHRLAEYFDCDPSVEAVVTARNAMIRAKGYPTYAKDLHDEAQIRTLIMDFGYPLPQVPIDVFREEVGVEVIPLLRIEVLIQELLDTDIGWSEFQRRYDDSIAEALTNGGYKGLKSIIAYRTGLDISPLSRAPEQGMQALDVIRRARGRGGNAVKQLRDHLFCRAIELCIEHDVPFQVHTGMGDWEVHLAECRPALLMDLFRFPPYRACRFLLVHTGYPYHAEAGYLANVLPNIWCDLSEGLPFAGNAGKRIIREVLEMAPVSRVCYGSDTFGSPEPFYTSAILGKQAVKQALTELVDDVMISSRQAQQIGEMILWENAHQLYRL